MENDNLQRVGDVVISNNEDGNKRHNASDGKFAKKETGDGKVTPWLSDTALGIIQKETPVYQPFLDNNIPFKDWSENAKNHFIDDKLSMEYFEKHFIPEIMEKNGYKAYRNLAGTEYDKKGVDYVFLTKDNNLVYADLKNINASFNSKSFLTDSINFRAMQTVVDKATGKMNIIDGYLFNKNHKCSEVFIQMLNAGMDFDTVGKMLLSGKTPQILKHSFFTMDSEEINKVISSNFGGEDSLKNQIRENLESLMNGGEFYKENGYETRYNKNGQPTHISIPIPKIGNAVTPGANFAYDIKYSKKTGRPLRYTCVLVLSKNVAASTYIFKSSKNYTSLLTKQKI